LLFGDGNNSKHNALPTLDIAITKIDKYNLADINLILEGLRGGLLK
jgi:hypothetical protein